MNTLLSLTLIVEPDHQRFLRFAVNAVRELGGNSFAAVTALNALLPRLRAYGADGPFDVRLLLDQQRLSVGWGENWEVLTLLNEMPTEGTINQLTARLKEASEAANVELLIQRNQRIKRELETSKQRAAKEMADMETSLEKKKDELKTSIRKAETDSLTGLLNRGAYDTRLLEAFRRCRRQSEPLTLIFFDLDYFKEINDTHGHQYGDEYLIRMAKVLRSSIRADVDYTCRFGGDEFAIILYADVDRAEERAKQVLDKMDGRVSIGIASLLLTDTVETFAKRTDTALYAAKRRGRGQFVVYSDELEKPDAQNANAKDQSRQP